MQDIINDNVNDNGWVYSDEVKSHFFSPQNFLKENPKEGEFDAEGEAGNFKCGDIMKMWIKVDAKTDRIKDLKWQTWGCASAIAATSVFSVMLTENGGMTLDTALKVTPTDIVERLHGLPSRKVHCSVLADRAFENAVKNYRNKK